MNEEKETAPAGGISFGTVNQSQEVSGAGTASQTMVGDAKAESVHNHGDGDPWADVYSVIDSEIDEAERADVTSYVEDLQALVEDPEAEQSAVQEIIEKLKPYKPIAKALLAAVRIMPLGGVAAPLIEGAFELAKS